VSRDRSLDEFVDETPESDATDTDATDDADANATDDADANAADDVDTNATDDADANAADDPDTTSADDDTEPNAAVVLPDPDDLEPLRPTFDVDPDGTCARCGAATTTRWWDDTVETDAAGDTDAGYVCADCKEW
jgi:hypothetical protein